jgi:hypothetical protein
MFFNEFNKTSDKIISLIERDCSESISYYKHAKLKLYRGFGDKTISKIVKLTSPENRVSRSINYSNDTFNLINQALKMLNFKCKRNNSVSCISDPIHARKYTVKSSMFGGRSPLCVTFPCNGFDFLWSSKFKDFGSASIKCINLNYDINNIDLNDAKKIVRDCGFRDDDFISALKSRNEIAIHGEYYAINFKYSDIINKFLGIQQ